MSLLEQIKAKIKILADKGIPLPLFRDMSNQQMSITYTMLIISFTLAVLAQFGLGELNPDKTIELLSYCGIGYLGRKWQKGSTTVEAKEGEQ